MRPILSTLDAWDETTKMEYPENPASPGRRPSWNVPDIAVTGEAVNTIRSSIANRQANTSIATVTATTVSPQYTNPSLTAPGPFPFKPVANMSAVIKPTSSVQVSWSTSMFASVSTSPIFVIYRDGRPISQQYHQVITGGIQSNFSSTYVDNNATPLKYHTYTLYCRPTSTPVTFYQKGRVFQVSDMRAT